VKRLSQAPGADTTVWRILHEARADLWVDHFDGHWLVQTREAEFPGFLTPLAKGVATSVYWRPRDKAAATAPVRVSGIEVTERFAVQENGASFWIDFAAGYSCGIFTDQRLNRRWVGEQVKPGERVLNTFAYTGGFSVMAARSGAETTTADLSGTYLDWTWDNFALNGLDRCRSPRGERRCDRLAADLCAPGADLSTASCSIRRPSRGAARTTFRTDRDYADLAGSRGQACSSPGGWLLCCANTHRLSAAQFQKRCDSRASKCASDGA
jgi:23S rRNA (cytosine1962-C5)-methyltransferase